MCPTRLHVAPSTSFRTKRRSNDGGERSFPARSFPIGHHVLKEGVLIGEAAIDHNPFGASEVRDVEKKVTTAAVSATRSSSCYCYYYSYCYCYCHCYCYFYFYCYCYIYFYCYCYYYCYCYCCACLQCNRCMDKYDKRSTMIQ